MSKLEGKVALITGSGRGIGQAIAMKLASEGAKVVINDIDEAPAAETVALIEKLGGTAAAYVGDVTKPDFGAQFVNTALEKFGGIDIIVNNAGYAWDSVIQKMSDEQWQAMLDVHVTAPFRVLRAAADWIKETAKKEKEQGQRNMRKVVNISSIGGLFGNAGQAGYSSGKTALIGLTKTLAKEWGRYNVTVNCVAFGYIQTRMTQALAGDAVVEKIGERNVKMGLQPDMIAWMNKMIPLGRGGTPEEAAGAVYLLCIPESDYVSGEVLLASGGFVM
ncbi:MAG: SDR family oxidoreductase [Rhodospirillales bacterium]|nr:SDR family oxidoreductase [Rhodospirillales bacterium]